MAPRWSAERIFALTFAVSLAIHLVLLIAQFISFHWLSPARTHTPLEVIYEYEIAKQELRQLQQQLLRAKRETIAAVSSNSAAQRWQIRVSERPLHERERALSEVMPDRSPVVDLTNLIEASKGDPVLLIYFSAVREQIQQTANRHSWLTGEAKEGFVYVSFVLTSSGQVVDASIVSGRSSDVQQLREIALRIVKMSAPFPQFPPSILGPSKTVLIPIEFLIGS
jgi:TonB family protein